RELNALQEQDLQRPRGRDRHQLMRLRQRGFTLVELAVGFTSVPLLPGSLLYTLSAQTEQRTQDETRRRLEQARELVLSFAVVNGRLPWPARSVNTTTPVTTAGGESRH